MRRSQPATTKYIFHSPEEYRKAISDLEASSDAIESHISISKQIADNVKINEAANSSHHPQFNSTAGNFQNQTQRHHKQLNSQIISQHTAITHFLQTSSSSLARSIASTLITIDDLLSRHDYTFTQLGASLNTGSPAAAESEDGLDEERVGIERMLDALVSTEREVIRQRLDRVYLEAFHASSSTSTFAEHSSGANTAATNGSQIGNHGQNTDLERLDDSVDEIGAGSGESLDTYTATIMTITSNIQEIQSDLRALSAEIDDLSSMLVAHEHGGSVRLMHERIAGARRMVLVRKRRLAQGRIQAMTDEVLAILDQVRGLQGQRIVVQRLKAAIDELELDGSGISGAGGQVEWAAQRKRKVDGPSLINLRSYLGLERNLNDEGSRARRIKDVFGHVKREMETAMSVQEVQDEILNDERPRRPRQDSKSNQERDSRGDMKLGNDEQDQELDYGALLDNIDGEIAKVKEAIDGLSA